MCQASLAYQVRYTNFPIAKRLYSQYASKHSHVATLVRSQKVYFAKEQSESWCAGRPFYA